LAQTFDTFVSPGDGLTERAALARTLYGVVQRALTGLGFAAVWGLAAGSAVPALAIADIYKVPMVLALSAMVATPAVLVTRHLLRLRVSPVAILSALVNSLYRGSLVLLGIAPLLGVYAYTSQRVAPLLAQGSAFFAVLCGAYALRGELSRLDLPRWRLTVLGGVMAVTLLLALLQLVSLATPVLTLPTVFGHGIDGVLR
jgi:hypothetical protein